MSNNERKEKKPEYAIVKIRGIDYYRITRKVGMKKAATGVYVPDYKQFYGRTLKEAKAKYKAYVDKQKLGGSTIFGEAIEQWLENTFSRDNRYTATTKARYIDAYRRNFELSDLLTRELSDLSGSDLQRAYNNMTCGASSVKALHKLLRLFFQYAEREGISRDITRSLILPKVEQKRKEQTIDTLSVDEINTILNAFEGHRLRLLIILALRTGARIAELLALEYDDITDEGIRINKQVQYTSGNAIEITKTKTPSAIRVVPISSNTAMEIANHRAWHNSEMLSNGYRTKHIFTTNTGNLYFDASVRKQCNRVYRDAGVRQIGFHIYRHTFASNLAHTGTPIQTVASLLGHSDVSVTSKYYLDIANDEKKKAIERMSI